MEWIPSSTCGLPPTVRNLTGLPPNSRMRCVFAPPAMLESKPSALMARNRCWLKVPWEVASATGNGQRGTVLDPYEAQLVAEA